MRSCPSKLLGARLGYANKAPEVSAATTQTESDLTTAGRFKDMVVGASCNFGAVKVSGAVRRFSYADARQTNLLLGLWVPLGQGQLKASWQRDAGGNG